MTENALICGAIDIVDSNDHLGESIVICDPKVVTADTITQGHNVSIEAEACTLGSQGLALFHAKHQIEYVAQAATTSHRGDCHSIDKSLVEAKIDDKVWLQSNNFFIEILESIYSAFHEFNALFKWCDPYPNFPLLAVAASPGAAARTATTTMYRPSYIPSNTGFEATFRASYANARTGSMPVHRSGNDARTMPLPSSLSLPGTHGSGTAYVMPGTSYVYLEGTSFCTIGCTSSNPFSSSSFSTWTGSNIYGTSPSQSTVPLYTQIGDTSNFGYQHGSDFFKTDFTTNNPFSSPISSPILSPPSFSPTSSFTSPTLFSSSPITSPPSFSTNTFAPTIFPSVNLFPSPPSLIATPISPILTPAPITIPNLGASPLPMPETMSFQRILTPEEHARYQAEQWAQDEAEQQKALQATAIGLLPPDERSQEERRHHAAIIAQVAKEISAELKRLYGIFYAHNIWVDINYVGNIISLPIELIISILQNGHLAERLLERARIKPETAGQAPTSSSGDGGDGTDYYDEVVRKALERFAKEGLDDHEGGIHGGHTIERHVGKLREWLYERMKRDTWIEGSTSFPDVETANRYTLATIRRNAGEIAKWLRNATVKETKGFTAEFNDVVGYGYDRAGRYFEYITKVMVRLVKIDNGFSILTSYPLI